MQQYSSSGKPPKGEKLAKVAQTFATLQQKRHTADYDIAFDWDRSNARGQIDQADEAFKNWREIRETEEAQDYLLNLFLPKPPRP